MVYNGALNDAVFWSEIFVGNGVFYCILKWYLKVICIFIYLFGIKLDYEYIFYMNKKKKDMNINIWKHSAIVKKTVREKEFTEKTIYNVTK